MAVRLAQAAVRAQWVGLQGRAILSTKSRHFIADAPLALGGPNEEITPLDLVLAACASNTTFMCERISQELGIPLDHLSAEVTGRFDPRGMRGEPVDPRLQSIHILVEIAGPTPEQAAQVLEAYRARCAIYNTLISALPIEIELILTTTSVARSQPDDGVAGVSLPG